MRTLLAKLLSIGRRYAAMRTLLAKLLSIGSRYAAMRTLLAKLLSIGRRHAARSTDQFLRENLMCMPDSVWVRWPAYRMNEKEPIADE